MKKLNIIIYILNICNLKYLGAGDLFLHRLFTFFLSVFCHLVLSSACSFRLQVFFQFLIVPLQARQRYHMVFKWILHIRRNIFFIKAALCKHNFHRLRIQKCAVSLNHWMFVNCWTTWGKPTHDDCRHFPVAVRLTHFTHRAEGSLAAVMQLRSPSVCVKSRLCFAKSHFIPHPRRHFLIFSFYYSALSKLILNQAHSLFQTPPERFECTCWLAATQLASLWM